MAPFEPAYRALLGTGDLERRAAAALEHLRDCDLCGRHCRVDRRDGPDRAGCRTGGQALVHSYGPHHGEEDPLRGSRGSGTIFFSGCNLRCLYCQNWEISQKAEGRETGPSELADMMLELQSRGCHNINFVTPSHVVSPILSGVLLAAERGLSLPLVYNTGGFDSPEALALLDGVIDIYMPDMKYGDSGAALRYSGVGEYVETNRAAVREMHRQVGDLVLDGERVALRGLLVRHMVLPGDLAGTESVLRFLAEEISPETYLNLMDQYHPCYRAWEEIPLDRSLSPGEFGEALEKAGRLGLHRLDGRRSRIFLFAEDLRRLGK